MGYTVGRKIVFTVGCIALASGCSESPDETQEIIDNLVKAGFPDDEIQVVKGVVYVGGDAAVSLAASREMLQTGDSSKEHYRTANIVSTALTKICIDGSAFTGPLSTALDQAIQNYNALPLTFIMARTPSLRCSATITAGLEELPPNVLGFAGFPSDGMPFPTITISDSLALFNADLIEHVITHEIGHTLGFRHSDWFNSISCGTFVSEGEAPFGAILIPGTPSGATFRGSLMNACTPGDTTGEFTASDVTAVTALYGACDVTKPFATPTLVPNVNSSVRDQGAVLVNDLTLIFGSDRGGLADLWTATRTSPTSPFGTPVPLASVNGSATGESAPALTDDGLTMYYAFVPAGQPAGFTFEDIHVSRRPTRTSPFPVGVPVPGINSSSADIDPYVTPDGSALFFDSARGATQLDLYVSFNINGSFSPPQPLTELNTSVPDGHPRLTQGGLRIYWSSTRSDGGAQGSTDIWTATRPSTTAPFGTPTRVPELSSSFSESPSWVSPDDCTIYLQSNRPGGPGLQDIYVAVRPK